MDSSEIGNTDSGNGEKNVPDSCIHYTVLNTIEKTPWEISIRVSAPRGSPFIRYMENAADKDAKFQFTAKYYDKELGYFVEIINDLAAVTDVTYWELLEGPGKPTDKGVSSFVPKDGDHITFNYKHDDNTCQE